MDIQCEMNSGSKGQNSH